MFKVFKPYSINKILMFYKSKILCFICVFISLLFLVFIIYLVFSKGGEMEKRSINESSVKYFYCNFRIKLLDWHLH